MAGGQQRATTSGGLIKTSTQIRETTLEAIEGIAEKEGLSRSAIIARLIDKGLAAERTEVAA